MVLIRVLSVMSFAVFSVAAVSHRSSQLIPTSRVDLRETWGGVCQDCKVDNTGPCVGTTCVDQKNGTWVKKVGTLISPIWCFNVAAGARGSDCSDSNPMDCMSESVCTDKACNNCGAAVGKDSRKTKCTLSGTLCNGPGG
jgi:hypothetical protein